jgi:hypothetical protein
VPGVFVGNPTRQYFQALLRLKQPDLGSPGQNAFHVVEREEQLDLIRRYKIQLMLVFMESGLPCQYLIFAHR